MKARLNPFSSVRIDNLPYRFVDLSEEQLWERLRALRFRAAIVGPKGHGKTTLLELIASKLPDHHLEPVWIRLKAEDPALPPGADPTSKQALLVEGADLLSRVNWIRLRKRARRAGGLLITAHRPGLLPTLMECHTSPDLLQELVASLAAPDLDLVELYGRHRGNLRDAFRELYDHYAG